MSGRHCRTYVLNQQCITGEETGAARHLPSALTPPFACPLCRRRSAAATKSDPRTPISGLGHENPPGAVPWVGSMSCMKRDRRTLTISKGRSHPNNGSVFILRQAALKITETPLAHSLSKGEHPFDYRHAVRPCFDRLSTNGRLATPPPSPRLRWLRASARNFRYGETMFQDTVPEPLMATQYAFPRRITVRSFAPGMPAPLGK